MAAKESQEMKKARKLVLAGSTPAAAAQAAGITRQAIYMAPWYHTFRGKPVEPKEKPPAKEDKKQRAAMSKLTNAWGISNAKKQ